MAPNKPMQRTGVPPPADRQGVTCSEYWGIRVVGIQEVAEVGTSMPRMLSWSVALLAILSSSSCVVPGTGPHDKKVGYNGDFEIVESDLPVNWTISRYPIEEGDAEALVDTTDAVSGTRSLKIVVHEFVGSERWKPFLFQVREAEAGQTYAVSFWLKNQGCKVLLEIGYEGKYHMFGGPSEAEKQGYATHPRIRAVLGIAETGDNEWRRFHYRYTLPETDSRIRFELKFLQTGTLWIDDVQIERIEIAESVDGATTD